MDQNKQYNNNFLSNVIFRIDFPQIEQIVENLPDEFKSKIATDFPILEPIEELAVEFEGTNLEIQTRKVNNKIWKFYSNDKNKAVELNSKYLALIYANKSYKNFTDFQAVVDKLLEIFFELYSPGVITRLGLRYINEINIDDKSSVLDWSKYINEKLVENLAFGSSEIELDIRRAFNLFVFNIGSSDFINFKYGIFNQVFPEKIVNKDFILDYDCHARSPFTSKEDIISRITQFNQKLSNLFEDSIKEDLRVILNK